MKYTRELGIGNILPMLLCMVLLIITFHIPQVESLHEYDILCIPSQNRPKQDFPLVYIQTYMF